MIQGRKRTKITIEKSSASVIPLRFEDMVVNLHLNLIHHLH